MKKTYTLFCLLLLSFGYAQTEITVKIDTLDIDDYFAEQIFLPNELQEISALEIFLADSIFLGLNDSGNKPELYAFKRDDGEIIQTIGLIGAANNDWEELAQSDSLIFIGDFGNNKGSRKDLTIYYFEKSQIDESALDCGCSRNEDSLFGSLLPVNDDVSGEKTGYQEVNVKKIEFYYPEQEHFKPGNKHDFDCEAMVYYNGKLHLFTKERKSMQTSHYTLEIKEEKQAATYIESFNTQYLVTGAHLHESFDNQNNRLLLSGYTPEGMVFISGFDFKKNESDLFFSANSKKFSLYLGFITDVGQVEGITFNPGEGKDAFCVSGEKVDYRGFKAPQQLNCFKPAR